MLNFATWAANPRWFRATAACFFICTSIAFAQEETDPPEVAIGERLFLETRFAQAFKAYLDTAGRVNTPIPAGDPVVDTTVTTGEPLPGPFAGKTINCRSCHLVDEHVETPGGGMRAYNDFARRSPVPHRAEDNLTVAPRNAPALVNATLRRDGGPMIHFDGEFSTIGDNVSGTFMGRNFGWLPNETATAIAHVARIIREDDGSDELAAETGGLSYSVLLTGTDPAIPAEFLLQPQYRLDPSKANDREVANAAFRLVSAYVENLVFSQDEDGRFNLSPYDMFLETNGLPRSPDAGEPAIEYSRRLLRLISEMERAGQLQFVTANPNTDGGAFQFHEQPFQFGSEELKGLRIFFTQPNRGAFNPAAGGAGNCISCHAAPNFTDFVFHNTGASQDEYDAVHAPGAFAQLPIPTLGERNGKPDLYLPATALHPYAKEPFRQIPGAAMMQYADLGLWNIFANPDFPEPQPRMFRILCVEQQMEAFGGLSGSGFGAAACSPDLLLNKAIARFKTPGLRDLGHSNPYMHNGLFDAVEDVVGFYRRVSEMARAGAIRNAAPDLRNVALTEGDLAPLAAFLKALNEDYE